MTMRTPRLLAAGIAGLLGTAGLMAGTMSSASAADAPQISYTCDSPLGTITSVLQVNLPESLTGASLPAGSTVPQTDGVTAVLTLSKDLIGQLQNFGIAGMSGSFAGDSKVGDAPAPLSLTIPNTPIAPNQPDGSESIQATGFLGSFAPSGTGTQNVTAPEKATFTLDVGLGSPIPVPCTVQPASKTTPIGTVTFAGEDTTSKHLSATSNGKTIAVKASTGSGDAATPGTGAVQAKGKVKVKSGKKVASKAVTLKGTLKAGKATLKLPKGVQKGSYKFTVTWDGTSTTVTVKVK